MSIIYIYIYVYIYIYIYRTTQQIKERAQVAFFV